MAARDFATQNRATVRFAFERQLQLDISFARGIFCQFQKAVVQSLIQAVIC